MLKVAQILVESRKDSYEEAERGLPKILDEYRTYIISKINDSQSSNLKGK